MGEVVKEKGEEPGGVVNEGEAGGREWGGWSEGLGRR